MHQHFLLLCTALLSKPRPGALTELTLQSYFKKKNFFLVLTAPPSPQWPRIETVAAGGGGGGGEGLLRACKDCCAFFRKLFLDKKKQQKKDLDAGAAARVQTLLVNLKLANSSG